MTAPGRATQAVRAGLESDRHWGAVVPPIHLSSTFTFRELGVPRKHDYTRSGNPTRDLLATAIGDLEGGEPAVITATGMAAITTVLQLVGPGELVVAPQDAYGGTWRLLTALAERGALELDLVDPTDDEDLVRALARGPRLCWIETPSNPLLRITDLARVRDLCQAAGSLFVADNTFLSPALQRPLEWGADIVVHSTTKYLNGHSDVVGGAIVAGTPDLAEKLAWWANCLGVTGSPFDAWLTLRGVRTLDVRCTRQEENARAVVEALVGHPSVGTVCYPGLPDHPGHAVAARQQDGFGAMVSFDLRGGRRAVEAFVSGLDHFSLAESLGGVESLVAHPDTMTHAAMSETARRRAGITEGLLRLSIGIEGQHDLVADVQRGLERASAAALEGREASCLG
jgi:cystathionine gamma-synthase